MIRASQKREITAPPAGLWPVIAAAIGIVEVARARIMA